jgi:parallel beta-helix repeat protein
VGDHTRDSVFQGNTVFNTWGEGIMLMACDGFIIEDNIVYDNFALNLYSEHSANVVIQRNLVYHTGAAAFLRGGNPPYGIKIADEAGMDPYTPATLYSHDIRVLNNMVMGHEINFVASGDSPDPGGLLNSIVANNTFVNARSLTGSPIGMVVTDRVNTNARIENNIILQDSGSLTDIANDPDLHFSHNLWSRTPPSHVASPDDIVGNPLLALTGPTGAGELLPDYFKLQAGSPAIGRAKVISEITGDFFRHLRDSSPDIGAHEFGATEADPSDTRVPIGSANAPDESGCAAGTDSHGGTWIVWTMTLLLLGIRRRMIE